MVYCGHVNNSQQFNVKINGVSFIVILGGVNQVQIIGFLQIKLDNTSLHSKICKYHLLVTLMVDVSTLVTCLNSLLIEYMGKVCKYNTKKNKKNQLRSISLMSFIAHKIN